MIDRKFWIFVLIGVVGFAAWAFMAYQDASLRADFLTFVKDAVIGIVGLALREMPTANPTQILMEKSS